MSESNPIFPPEVHRHHDTQLRKLPRSRLFGTLTLKRCIQCDGIAVPATSEKFTPRGIAEGNASGILTERSKASLLGMFDRECTYG